MDERPRSPTHRQSLLRSVPPYPNRSYSAQARLDWTPQKPARKSRERDEEAIERWKKEGWPSLKKEWLRQKRIILFIDESGFYLLPHVVRTWARRGQRPVLMLWSVAGDETTICRLSVIGGITPEGELYMRSQEEPLDSTGVVAFLRHLLERIEGKLGIILDGAGIHRSREVRALLEQGAAKRIELVRLPSYAPELNPTEGVWSLLKSGSFLRNFGCHDLFQLKHLFTSAACALRSRPALVRSCFHQAGCY